MPEQQTIVNALKTTGTSRFIRKLKPDQLLTSVRESKTFVEKYHKDDPQREKVLHTARLVSKGSHFAYNLPVERPNYRPLITSKQALADLNLAQDSNLIEFFCGKKVYIDDQIFPYSIAYAGFQFGEFAGQLGDGRIVNLFDIKDKKGNYQTIQLKGSGTTPFSRFADGKAILRSSIREFIISESLYHIGIPSTRAVQLTQLPGTKAMRSKLEPCAVVCRFSPTWIRLGNFDLLRWRPNLEGLIKLSDFCIEDVFDNGKLFPREIDINIFKSDFFPDNISEQTSEDIPAIDHNITDISKYDLFYRHVVNLNAKCVAYWQAYGFLNGVLNTDNTSIMGLSIDFGPFSFMDRFDPNFTPNHDDALSRYCFANQPDVIWWNLAQFAQSISILIGSGSKLIDEVLRNGYEKLSKSTEEKLIRRANTLIKYAGNEYKYRFTCEYASLISRRLGLKLELNENSQLTDATARQNSINVKEFCDVIIEPLLKLLQKTKIDYNNFFTNFQRYNGTFLDNSKEGLMRLDRQYAEIFFNQNEINNLIEFQGSKLGHRHDQGETRLLVELIEDIYTWTVSFMKLAGSHAERHEIASKVNPIFTPRSWIFDEVIDSLTEAQKDKLDDPNSELDSSLLRKLHLMSSNPYDPTQWDDSLVPEVVNRWANLGHPLEVERYKFMQQGTCSS